MVTLTPAGAGSARGLGVVVALHGLGGDAAGTARSVALGMAAAGTRGFAVVTVDGGTTYWHRRADGDDPQGMIVHEVLPRLHALGMRTGRIGIIGQSMGGYGALLLAERLGGGPGGLGTARARTHAAAQPSAAAVAAISPAIFASFADARQADRPSFDGPGDFAAHDVFSGMAALRQVPAYVACGSSDPFEPMAREFRERLQRLTGRPPAGAVAAGCHDYDFWARNLPPALTFIGARLV
jgi:S-formylglutathione hydrolase FrmB